IDASMAPKDRMIVVRVDEATKRRLEEAAQRKGKTMTTFLVEAGEREARRVERTPVKGGVHGGVPTYFRANCFESSRGGDRGDDGRIYQRGRIFWVEYWHHGQAVRESSKGFVATKGGKPSDGTDRRAAEKLLKERLRTAGTAHFIGPQMERVDFKALADLYVT